MKKTIKLSLEPYFGNLYVAHTKEAYNNKHKSLFGDYDEIKPLMGGRFASANDKHGTLTYLIWAKDKNFLVHEMSHVVLDLFEITGIDPRECGGEPFCYMLCSLLSRCK
tara:strand:+ start:543 stop:869 length:327 start_codon:yes stop_codon:yes gene_type:complete